jgi:hypothetical protein
VERFPQSTVRLGCRRCPGRFAQRRRGSHAAGVGNRVKRGVSKRRYSKDSASKARRETCLDQYKANKANNGNGSLKWIQKGGGYYSECTKKLKGAV